MSSRVLLVVSLATLAVIVRRVVCIDIHQPLGSIALLETNLPEYEIAVLDDIYTSLNGPYWEWGQEDVQFPGIPWNFSAECNPCSQQWQGVNCTTTGSDGFLHVEQLILFQMLLYGTLPDSIAQLSALEQLNVGFNTITGSLPASMGNLTNLNTFIAEGNDLTGYIPRSFETLRAMQTFNVYDNYMSGSMPNATLWVNAVNLNFANNKFNGTIPPSLGGLVNLQTLFVDLNYLTGSIPETLGQLEYLQQLICNGNLLTGTIPESLGRLSNLQQLMLNSNFLQGTIPASLGQLQRLQYLYLYSNHLNSTIPAALGNMSSLLYASLQANHLHGTIPSSLCNITTLSALRAQNNFLTGTLPACLTLNPAFAVLVLYNNFMSGPLPSVFAEGSLLNYFDLNGVNYFTGTLPEAFGALKKLNSIYVGGNQLTGPIPPSYGAISSLVSLYLVFNRLTGNLPVTLGALHKLQLLEVSGNDLFGPLPATLGNLTQLLEIHADNNHFVGTIPPELTALSLLQTANLFSNHLHGTIPERLGDLSLLVYLGFDGNILTGTVPESIGELSALENLELYNNHLRGTLPGSIRNLSSLTNLLLQGNHFSGSLDGRFSSVIQTALSVIQLSNNEFTGSIPDEAFHTPRLQTFAAVSNCFEGSLPRSACANTMVQVLAMSGLQSSPACQQKLLPGIAKSYVIRNPISGGIPDCLFEIPSLTTLQLAGNGLTGQLPDDVRISPTLRDLSLSHNTLSGTIPAIFQQRAWSNFDVSFNRLYGELNEQIEVATSATYNLSYTSSALSLENNRLSGDIPNSIKNIVNISVLSGNLFTCSVDQSDLPRHDSAATNYECGSTTFNVPYILWGIIIGLLLILAVGVAYASRAGNELQIVYTLRNWLYVLDRYDASDVLKVPLLNMRYATELYYNVGKIAVLCTAFCIVVLLPLYAVMSTYYGTLEHQYAYAVSAAFHTGSAPLALELVALVLLQCIVLVSFVVYLREPAVRVEQQVRQSVKMHAGDTERKSSLLGRVAVYCALLVTNTAVVVGMNVAYVYIALYQTSSLLLFAQIVLSVFKLVWNKFSGTSLIPWTARYVSPSVTNDLVSSSVEFFPLQLFLSLFNNIAIPCLVVAVVSPNCFSNVFTESPSVDSVYIVNQCLVVDNVLNECDEYYPQEESTAFNPPFTYSYQCSASFVTYYAPAFVIMCIMSTFGLPAVQSVLVYLHTREVALMRRTGEETWRYRLLEAMLPTLLKPPPPPPAESVDLTPEQARQSLADLEERWTVLQKNIYSPHFPANQVLLNMFTFLGILLTFGVVFPPLAAALAVTAIGSGLYARLKVGRFLTAALEQKQVKFFDLVDQECRGVGSLKILLRSAFMLLSFSCCFYTLFLFDTYGDAVGLHGAYWVLIVLPLLPVILYGAYQLSASPHLLTGKPRQMSEQEQAHDGAAAVELQQRPTSVRKTVAFREDSGEVGDATVNAMFAQENA